MAEMADELTYYAPERLREFSQRTFEHFGVPASRLGYWRQNELAPPWRPVA